MKYILEIDGKKSTKYKYNLWEVVDFDDGSVMMDVRIISTDDTKELVQELEKL